jgi:hypothetical protein
MPLNATTKDNREDSKNNDEIFQSRLFAKAHLNEYFQSFIGFHRGGGDVVAESEGET